MRLKRECRNKHEEKNPRIPNVIAVDFDGTLFSNAWPEIGEPNWKLIKWCQERQELGDTLILWTCRHGKYLKAAVAACKEVGLHFDYINNHCAASRKAFGAFGQGKKIFATVYIDDKAFRPTETERVSEILNNRKI